MQRKPPSGSSLRAENAALRDRLEEVEDALRAIRQGEVDALVVETADGTQVFALQGIDAEANRFRGAILAQIHDAVVATDGEGCITYLNAAAARQYGCVTSTALGRQLSYLYEVRWPDPADAAASAASLRQHGEWCGENVHVRRNGGDLHVETGLTVLRDEAGQPAGMLAIIHDVTERRRHEDKVLVSELRYRRLFEAAHDGVLLLDAVTGKIIDANPFMTQMLGYPRDALIGKELFEIGLLRDEAASQEMFRRLKRANQVRYDDLPLEGLGGRHHEVEVVANLYDEGSRSVIQCNIRDITERKRAEAHVTLLMAEVNHRAKNLLAIVEAVALQTTRYGDPATFVTRLSERIGGLAAGQDLLVKNQWNGVDVSDLVEAQLAHFKDLIGTRVVLEGPRARLTTAAAQGIGMALHELTTNAVKYGALSNRDGRVRIAWQVTTNAQPAFSMSWLEDGGPKVVAPARNGFGQMVIGRMAEAAVQGTARITFRETGVAWNLSAPSEHALLLTEEMA